jgi:hypothetical protein
MGVEERGVVTAEALRIVVLNNGGTCDMMVLRPRPRAPPRFPTRPRSMPRAPFYESPIPCPFALTPPCLPSYSPVVSSLSTTATWL